VLHCTALLAAVLTPLLTALLTALQSALPTAHCSDRTLLVRRLMLKALMRKSGWTGKMLLPTSIMWLQATRTSGIWYHDNEH
jgi:hypothetical protein